MFYSHADDVSFFINVNIDILTWFFGLMDDLVCELYVCSICVGNIFHSHVYSSLYDLSIDVLTVSDLDDPNRKFIILN